MTKKNSTISRRAFLSNLSIVGASSAVGVGGLLNACSDKRGNESKFTPLRPAEEYYIPELGDKAVDGKPIRAALIGCGSRGTGAAMNFLNAGDNLSIVACADIFPDKIERCRNRLKDQKNNIIADDMCFLGFDSHKKVCETDVDMVIIASPSLFHAGHMKYAIEQGKHVFCEKPAAIDAVGFRNYMIGVKQAQSKGLCVVTGTQRHHDRGYIESYKKVQEGYIGRIVSANVYWNQGHVGFTVRRPEWTSMEHMIRDHFSWKWLCGDHVLEQLVHNVDVFTWFSHMKPVRVIGMGSCQRRIAGNIYDNLSVDIEYENNIHVHGMTRQINDCDNRIGEIIQGTKGSWTSLGEHTIRDLDGNVVWQYDREAAKEQFKQHDPYTLEHVNLVNHLRWGKVINLAETTAISSMTCVMAREAAYTGKAFTWDEMTQSDLNYMPAELTLDNVDMSKYTISIPGSSPVV